jgi:putative membrane protein
MIDHLLSALLVLVAVEHLYFLYLEMFRWTNPSTVKAFNLTPVFAEQSRTLAANQGLYNGFLAAGLLWAVLAPADLRRPVAIFFASCVTIAGIYGGATVGRRIFFVQALPGALTLLLALVSMQDM